MKSLEMSLVLERVVVIERAAADGHLVVSWGPSRCILAGPLALPAPTEYKRSANLQKVLVKITYRYALLVNCTASTRCATPGEF